MTHAILPMNLRALRVNANDSTLLTSRFKGRVAQFEMLPSTSSATTPSTGAAIVQPLESPGSPISSLKPGLHLHWELPDVYKRGVQGPEGRNPVFPHAPNTWLITRYLQQFDAATQSYGAVQTMAWIVESDYIATQLGPDADGILRPAITVPLPERPSAGSQPYRYMGRVIALKDWTGPGPASDYLTAYAPNYLTSIGFVGPSFASYYPECNSVFGFWDHFGDLPNLRTAILANAALQFRVSYQVTGWLREAAMDVFSGFGTQVQTAWNSYVTESAAQNTPVTLTPADEFVRLASQQFRLAFNGADVSYRLNPDKTLASLDAPEQGICSGLLQNVVWNMQQAPSTSFFLNNPDGPQPNACWTDSQIKLAVGNTTIEALSALIKTDLALDGTDSAQLGSIEMMLDALQLGLLHDLESAGDSLITLDEALHARGFAREFGGYVWTVEPSGTRKENPAVLPLALAELLTELNRAQKAYDQGRAELSAMRRQLFMDWLRYVNAYVNPASGLQVSINTLAAFLDNGTASSELGHVVARGDEIGMTSYVLDPETGAISGLNPPPGTNKASLAVAVYAAWTAARAALPDPASWRLQAAPAPAFWQPNDPVLVMQGDRLEPVRRNGDRPETPARLSNELLTELGINLGGTPLVLQATAVSGPPVIGAAVPMAADVQALAAEACLLVPMLAENVAAALTAQTGSTPPGFATALMVAQGGSSPLDPPLPTGSDSLYDRLHQIDAGPLPNPQQSVSTPLAIDFTFTNAAGIGWTPYGTAVTAQVLWPEFTPNRVDPFLPVFLLWEATLQPLAQTAATGSGYSADVLTANFQLDADDIDYSYSAATGFPTTVPVSYSGSVTLARQPTRSLTSEIDRYERMYPADAADADLTRARTAYQQAQIMSQGIDGFDQAQVLQTQIARIPVEDLVKGGRDAITANIDAAAQRLGYDNWYSFGFNGVAPISQGLQAANNFGPLRAGFAQIRSLEIVDVFGQRMSLQTTQMQPNGAQDAIAAFTLTPPETDTAHPGWLYLPPRLLAPSRVWMRWLSASFDTKVKGFNGDFVEMNSHPESNPICGIVVPNHLDDSLLFYQADGQAIGSFAVEHGDLVYRTRAGNADNPDDSLATDIGPSAGPALVNPHLFDVMWHINTMGAGFLTDMMTAIRRSEGFVNPASYAQNVALGVLLGQPLVIARAVVAIETAGGILPVSQADTQAHPDFTSAVEAGLYRYSDRQAVDAAGLQDVTLPVQLGNLANMNDGMIGYFLDTNGPNPYGSFYAPTAPQEGAHGVVQPVADTLTVTLNAAAVPITFLADPRGAIHATTGILPVQQIALPPDQWARILDRLQVSFDTHPVLQGADGLCLPLPQEQGYAWSWIQTGQTDAISLTANAGSEMARFGYSPQTLLEGWTQLGRVAATAQTGVDQATPARRRTPKSGEP